MGILSTFIAPPRTAPEDPSHQRECEQAISAAFFAAPSDLKALVEKAGESGWEATAVVAAARSLERHRHRVLARLEEEEDSLKADRIFGRDNL